jgi:hypothetical protein
MTFSRALKVKRFPGAYHFAEYTLVQSLLRLSTGIKVLLMSVEYHVSYRSSYLIVLLEALPVSIEFRQAIFPQPVDTTQVISELSGFAAGRL